ncbi:hypothetical protein ACUY3K_05795 [Corynebacterium uberis]|uniref:hypothetical protein n=1 Tax=Corynebacterium TaxID=1716 RepID=UPI001D0BC507|nr:MULTISPECIES: hypothetical protein [Corynebacterium]MCZ9310086.1 hypothetical protein [Corynebacterium sp. c6VSa_13]UDL73832.1 hypothetical protein LH391_00930 [Corynebacterium uberis]UDL75284.1 hypothetical protein LH393_08480 [Corynebacterium uberis]UDL77495.1 hypothetical protein LH394_08460 [Corynebacterium uberis]UDL79782.1 hypothetical protein LH392_08895 [Corynebacterium uberis]
MNRSPRTPRHWRTMPATLLAVALTAAATSAAASAAAAPDSPQPVVPASSGPAPCVPQLGDVRKGNGQFPLGLVAPDYGRAGWDELPVVGPAQFLPQRVDLRDNTQGFNDLIDVALHAGRLFVRPRPAQDAAVVEQWRELPTPDCLAGHIVGISLNDDALVALDEAGWMYTLSNLLSSPNRWGWIRAWGGPVWLGKGLQSPTTQPGRWVLSLIGNHTDLTYDTPDGKHQPVSLAKVTQVLALSEDGSRLYMLDPWLARDYSYEVGMPLNSRFQAQSVSASGSVVVVTNKYGDMYTRLSDFDVNGSDPAQFRYVWGDDPRPEAADAARHRLDPNTAPIGLPADDWHHQPKIPGRITDRISVHSTAPGSSNRELSVEGIDAAGRTGYWHKALGDPAWAFSVTDQPVRGRELENSPRDRSEDTLAAPSEFNFAGEVAPGASISVEHFAYASPRRDVTLTVGGRAYPLVLHTIDGRMGTPLSMRALPGDGEFGARPAGLVQAVPRNYAAAFEVPEATRAAASTDPELAAFLAGYLGGQRFHEVYLKVTPSAMQVINSPVPGVAVPVPGGVAELAGF